MKTRSTFLFLFAALTLPALAHALQYDQPVCIQPGSQSSATVISDGYGGAIIVWADQRGADTDIYAQRMNAAGYMLWSPNGVPICTAVDNQYAAQVVSDGGGGAIITWLDMRLGEWFDYFYPSPDIYAQRIDAQGNVQWATNGIPVCTADYGTRNVTMVKDAAGGAFIAWGDDRNGPEWQWPLARLYMQHINASGQALWTVNGVSPCADCRQSGSLAMAPDAAGGAIVVSGGLLAYRVDASGTSLWGTDGVYLSGPGGSENQAVIPDGSGGAIVTWDANREINGTYGYHIYAQRLNSSGVLQWPTDGVALCEAPVGQFYPRLVSDGAHGAIVTWYDLRSVWQDIYAQRVDAAGIVQWQTDGVPVCVAGGDQQAPTIAADNAGGAIISWQDYRTGQTYYYWDIYAQRVDGSGTALWTANGIPLSTSADAQVTPVTSADGGHGAFVAWTDSRSGDTDIYAQHVDETGEILTGVGEPVPAARIAVSAAHPNPFSGSSTLDLTMESASPVRIEVFDVAGHRVRDINMGRLAAGTRQLVFDGRDNDARLLPSGVYFYRVHAAGDVVTRKMVIAR